ncbi:zinc ribbon domain-containing protein [candidate division KSB1 bacterium]|nr:zinc ribbon domain-containing protein [candidate division KSB1 bacterium]
MPTYEYHCLECGHKFTETLQLKEREAQKPQCPKCRSQKVQQIFSSFFAKTSKKS